jgi:hypothetical protein
MSRGGRCIRCEKLMTFLGRVTGVLDYQQYYAFWCPGCGVATSHADVD